MTLARTIRALPLAALAVLLAACGGASDGPNGPAALTNSIVFVSNRTGVDEIYVMKADGTGARMIPTLEGQKSYPVPSPNGRKIAFTVGTLETSGTSSMYVVNTDGTELTRLTMGPGIDYTPTWSPTGQQIAFVSTRDDNSEIYLMNADGTNQVNLTNEPLDDSRPSWSPSGNRILFQSDRIGQANIYSMTPAGASVTLLTSGSQPQWSPSGTRYLFKQGGQLWIATVGDPGTFAQLTSHAGAYFTPGWSTDESKIVYADATEEAEEIWTLNSADGSGGTQLTPNDQGDSYYPSWTRH